MTATVNRYLDLSTAHLPARLRNPAAAGGEPGVIVEAHPYGYWLWVPTDVDGFAADYECDGGTEPALLEVLRHARSLGCDWVRVDRDAQVDDALRLYPH